MSYRWQIAVREPTNHAGIVVEKYADHTGKVWGQVREHPHAHPATQRAPSYMADVLNDASSMSLLGQFISRQEAMACVQGAVRALRGQPYRENWD